MLRILRWAGDEDHWACESGARQRDVTVVERAGRRCRADHSLELSAAHGRVETCSGACGGVDLRAEAGRADTADCAGVRETFCGVWFAARRGQHRDRIWGELWCSSGPAS